MSRHTSAAIIPFPRNERGPALDYAWLLRMACFYGTVDGGPVEVVDDEDGAVSRFLGRAPRGAFDSREEFVAAAMKRYLDCIGDPHLAELMYVAALFQAGDGTWITVTELRRRLRRLQDGHLPDGWLELLEAPDLLDAAVLERRPNQLSFVLRGLRWWVYGNVEA
jgi:hypothetical protein